jgi:ribosomal-protein-alanine N-acetyltransferase
MFRSEVGRVASLFAETPEASHWSAQDVAELEASGTRIWVDVQESKLAGAVASREAAGETEILNLAVAPGWRRRGIGLLLMETALESAASAGVGKVFLEVRESNAGARAFYSRLGFAESGRRPNYYREPAEDALLLSRSL